MSVQNDGIGQNGHRPALGFCPLSYRASLQDLPRNRSFHQHAQGFREAPKVHFGKPFDFRRGARIDAHREGPFPVIRRRVF